MTVSDLQKWVAKNFDERLGNLSMDYGVARLLVQSGQFGDAALHNGDVAKEACDMLFVIAALANKSGIDLEDALQKNVSAKSPESFFSSLRKR